MGIRVGLALQQFKSSDPNAVTFMTEGTKGKPERGGLGLPRLRLSGVIALAIAAAFIAWLALRDNGQPTNGPADSPPAVSATASVIEPVLLTQEQLSARAASLGQPLYWAGPVPGHRYELSRIGTGNVYVRYLPLGVEAGDQRTFLTIGTYPLKGAFDTVQTLTKMPGARSKHLADGGVAYFHPDRPLNVYLAYPNLEYQIEVYSPASAEEARELAVSGRIRPLS